MIQREIKHLIRGLILNLKGIPGPKIENNLVPGAPQQVGATHTLTPPPLIPFGTPNNSVKASLSVSKARLIVCRDVNSKKIIKNFKCFGLIRYPTKIKHN